MYTIKKYLTLLILSYPFACSMAEMTKEDLKTTGYALANYETCHILASESGDAVLAYFYAQMLNDGELGKANYTTQELSIIDAEQADALIILNQINSASMALLCSNRLDPVSRQFYQTQLEKRLEK